MKNRCLAVTAAIFTLLSQCAAFAAGQQTATQGHSTMSVAPVSQTAPPPLLPPGQVWSSTPGSQMAQPALLPPAQIWSSTTTTSSFGPGAVSVQNATNTLLNPTNAATVLSPGEIGASTMPGSAATPVLLQPVLNVAPPGTATPGKLVITAGSFGHDTNLNKAYTEACQQQDAHFNEPFFYFRKAKLQIEMKNYSKAEQELKYLIVDDPMNSDYYIARAYCYHKMKKETAALDDLNSAKSRNPTLPQDIEFGD